jgi:hypothetical protein
LGYAEQAMNRPNFPALMTIGEPHLSQMISVDLPTTFRSGMTFFAPFRSFSNFL